MDIAILAMLSALIAAFGSAMIALLLHALTSFDNRFTAMDRRIDINRKDIRCIIVKVEKVAVLIGLAHPDIVKHKSPFKISRNDTVTEVIERYMKEEDGGDEDG